MSVPTKNSNEISLKNNPKNDFEQTEFSTILNKLKSRLPMFIISIYCTVTTMIFGNDFLNIGILVDDKKSFKVFYVLLCVWAIAWDVWHCVLAYEDKSIVINSKDPLTTKIIFCVLSFLISFPLFIVATNIVSFGLPLYLFFGFDKNMIVIFYGSVFPMIYFLNAYENKYWKNVVDKYIEIENEDDDESHSAQFRSIRDL